MTDGFTGENNINDRVRNVEDMARLPAIGWVHGSEKAILSKAWNGGRGNQLVVTPKWLSVNINYRRSTIHESLGQLVEGGLMERLKNRDGEVEQGCYLLTDLGERYMRGEVSDDELKELRAYDF